MRAAHLVRMQRKPVNQERRRVVNDKQIPVLRPDELLLRRMPQELQQMIEVALDVEDADGLRLQLQLQPGNHLEHFFERAIAARQHDEPIAAIGHRALALMHRLDDLQLGEAAVCNLGPHQVPRDDANDIAAVREHLVGERAHHADMAATIDRRQPATRENLRELARGGHIFGAGA